MSKKVVEKHWNFIDEGPGVVAAYNSAGNSPWVKRVTGSATCAGGSSGITLALDATSEAQITNLYMNDILSYDIDDILAFGFVAQTSVALGANARFAFGLGSAYNATLDSVAANAWFIGAGSSAVLCESDDGTNDYDDKSTGQTLAAAFKRFEIDFSSGLGGATVTGTQTGGKGNVKFSMSSGRDNAMIPVATGTRFNMENYSSGLQPMFQLQKSSSTNLGSVIIHSAWIRYRERP
jgi:hypothetical protein